MLPHVCFQFVYTFSNVTEGTTRYSPVRKPVVYNALIVNENVFYASIFQRTLKCLFAKKNHIFNHFKIVIKNKVIQLFLIFLLVRYCVV